MSRKREVIAIDGFIVGRKYLPHPSVIQTSAEYGSVKKGTRLWADDAIAVDHPTLFVDANVIPKPKDTAPPQSRRRGRRKGSGIYPNAESIKVEYARLKTAVGRPVTDDEFCAMASPPIARRTLQGYLREYGLDWPPE